VNLRHLLGLAVGVSLAIPAITCAQTRDYFSGFYAGAEAGVVSYDTHIRFDGVDDPAGRGGAGYGALFGYDRTRDAFLYGVQLFVNLASAPDPYTFDPAIVGFSELELRRGASVGLDVRSGYLVAERILLFGTIGASVNRQSVRIDDVPLDRLAGGSEPETFGAVQFGAGAGVAINSQLRLRAAFRTLGGHDLDASDFGSIPTEASLSFLDVEPRQQQFLVGLVYRPRAPSFSRR